MDRYLHTYRHLERHEHELVGNLNSLQRQEVRTIRAAFCAPWHASISLKLGAFYQVRNTRPLIALWSHNSAQCLTIPQHTLRKIVQPTALRTHCVGKPSIEVRFPPNSKCNRHRGCIMLRSSLVFGTVADVSYSYRSYPIVHRSPFVSQSRFITKENRFISWCWLWLVPTLCCWIRAAGKRLSHICFTFPSSIVHVIIEWLAVNGLKSGLQDRSRGRHTTPLVCFIHSLHRVRARLET